MPNPIIIIAGVMITALAIGLFCFLTLGLIQILMFTFRNIFYLKPGGALLEHTL